MLDEIGALRMEIRREQFGLESDREQARLLAYRIDRRATYIKDMLREIRKVEVLQAESFKAIGKG